MSKTGKAIMVLLGVAALVGFGVDACELAFGRIDASRDFLFVLPSVLVFFMWLTWKLD